LEALEKSFILNDCIHFAEEELQFIIITVTAFFQELFKFVHGYVQEQQGQ